MPADLTSLIKTGIKLAEPLQKQLTWIARKLPGLFPAAALAYILMDIVYLLPSSDAYRRIGFDILHFDGQGTVNVFDMKSSLATLPGDGEERPDPVTSGDIGKGVELQGRTIVPPINPDDFVDSLFFLTELPSENNTEGSDRQPNKRPTLKITCHAKGLGEKRTFVERNFYFAAPDLGDFEVGPNDGPQLAFNQSSRIYEIGLWSGDDTQLIQSDVPNLECKLGPFQDTNVGGVRLIGEQRITFYAMIMLGALAMWIAGARVLQYSQRFAVVWE